MELDNKQVLFFLHHKRKDLSKFDAQILMLSVSMLRRRRQLTSTWVVNLWWYLIQNTKFSRHRTCVTIRERFGYEVPFWNAKVHLNIRPFSSGAGAMKNDVNNEKGLESYGSFWLVRMLSRPETEKNNNQQEGIIYCSVTKLHYVIVDLSINLTLVLFKNILKHILIINTVQPTRTKHISRSAEPRCNESFWSWPFKPRQYVMSRRISPRCFASVRRGIMPRSAIWLRVNAHHKLKIF